MASHASVSFGAAGLPARRWERNGNREPVLLETAAETLPEVPEVMGERMGYDVADSEDVREEAEVAMTEVA